MVVLSLYRHKASSTLSSSTMLASLRPYKLFLSSLIDEQEISRCKLPAMMEIDKREVESVVKFMIC